MNRWLLASIALLGALLALLWFVGAGRSAPRRGGSVERARPAQAEAEPLELAPAAAEPVELPPSPLPAPKPEIVAPGEASTTRAAAGGAPADELARAIWVEGRVLLPAGTPLDEEVFVEARGKEFRDGSRHRAKVAADGRFRVAFSERSKTGWLALSGRYVYLEPAQRWKKSDTAPIELAPVLGGRIAGRLVAPAGEADARGTVRCIPDWTGQQGFFVGEPPTVEIGRELEFAFDALRPGEARLSYEGETSWAEQITCEVEAGATRAVELVLRRGASVAGRVIDAGGQPLAGVSVQATASQPAHFVQRETVSAADGRFRLGALPPGEIRLAATRAGHVDLQHVVAGLAEGEERADVELVFGTGGVIAGRVTRPDGSPARAHLIIRPEAEGSSSATETPFSIDGNLMGLLEAEADGRFRVAGLAPGSYVVKAFAGEDGKRTELTAMPWIAVAKGVAAGTERLELVLRESLVLAGRVTDDRGVPLGRANLFARPADSGAAFEFPASADTNADGSFSLRGLQPGRAQLQVFKEGHVRIEPLELELPALEPLYVVLPRGARVSGFVRDERGNAVARAWVRADREETGSVSAQIPRLDNGGAARADANGAFELDGLAAGRVTLNANAQGFVAGEAVQLELDAAEVRQGVVLFVRRAGRIAGEVRGRAGEPLAGVWVGVDGGAFVQSDADGRFELADLAPGETTVTAANAETGLRLSATATVSAGETAEVLLQLPASAVRLHGRVRMAGEPAGGASIRSQLREPKQDGPACVSAADGSYALELPSPGAYWIGVWGNDGVTHLWLALDVPRGPEFAHDLEVPVGRVSGRVRAQEGAALAGIRVEARQTSDETSESGWGRTITDERGEYELVLPPGTYELAAGGDGGDADPLCSFARATAPGVVVVDRSHLRGIDFELVEGSTLEGLVRWGDGTPAPGADLWLGPQGKSVQSSPLGKADGSGRFRIEGVAAGKVVVTATQGQGTAEWQKLELRPASVHALELELAASEVLEVRVLDRGVAVAAEVVAKDAKEKSFGSVVEEGPIARIGPVPSGRYVVSARLGERTATAEITLTGKQAKSTLEIVLP